MTDVPETEPTTAGPAGPTPPAGAEGEQVMNLLAGHVPLALLVDLITPQGPASADILRTEGMPDDAWWEPEDAPDGGDGRPAATADPTS